MQPEAPTILEKREEIKTQLSVIDFRTDLLGFWINLSKLLAKWLRLKSAPPYWYSVVFFTLATVAISLSLSLLVGKTRHHREDFILISIAFVILAPIVMIVLQKYFKNAFNTWRLRLVDSILALENLVDFQNWLTNFLSVKKRLLNGLGFSILAILLTLIIDITLNPELLSFGSYLMLFTLYFITGVVLFVIFLFMILSLRIRDYQFSLFKSDPASSEVVIELSNMFGNFVLLFSLILAIISLLSEFIDERGVIFLLFIGWIPVSLIFTIHQFTLRKIITNVKYRKLSSVQEKIENLEAKENLPSKETLDHLQALIKYHDYIKSTRNSALNLQSTLNFLNSLLLPLLAFVLGNLDTIVTLFFNRP